MNMKTLAKVLAALAATFLCFGILVETWMKYSQFWQIEQERIAVADFSRNRGLYNALLVSWTRLSPSKCGVPAQTPGFVSAESISVGSHDSYSLEINSDWLPNLNVDEIASKLGARPQDVRSLIQLLRAVKSPEIFQSGAELKILSPVNDTHSIMHIDPSCPDAAGYDSRSKSPLNPDGDPIRVRSLGDGWYYLVDQR